MLCAASEAPLWRGKKVAISHSQTPYIGTHPRTPPLKLRMNVRSVVDRWTLSYS